MQLSQSQRALLGDLEGPGGMAGGEVRVELLTSRVKGKARTAVLAGLASGDVDMVVGTHALLTEEVGFASLGAVVIDEQHRFGVEQRATLRSKGADGDPDLLVMTATPIPRTAAMVIFGDLDLTTLDELYGKSEDDRITLVTSASGLPWNGSKGKIVVATMKGTPYQPTLQNGRSTAQSGLSGDPGAWTSLLIALQALVLTVVGAVWLYRRSTMRTAYLLTVPPLIVFTILAAEAASRLLPAWA